MKLTFLGTGTSFGVPAVGCDCATCTSADRRDRRTRHGAIVEIGGPRLPADSPPYPPLARSANKIDVADTGSFTHVHADHVHGLDDLPVSTARRGNLTAYIPREHRAKLEQVFSYIFDESVRPPEGSHN